MKFVDPGFGALVRRRSPLGQLWGIGANVLGPGSRTDACDAAFGEELLFDKLKVRDASLGHPNRQGAAQYASRILDQLGTEITNWKGTPTVTSLTFAPSSLRTSAGEQPAADRDRPLQRPLLG